MKVNFKGLKNRASKVRCLIVLLQLVLWVMVAVGQDEPKKVSNTEANGKAVTKVAPEYPVIAKQLKIQGVVELEALVTEAGTVEKVNIVSGNPVLTKPAVEALKRWKFSPFQTDGKAVKVLAQVNISFKL